MTVRSPLKPIYCLGGANIDTKLLARQPVQAGTSNPVHAYTCFGGVARNVAENLSHWTDSVYLHTVVGEDDAGRQLLAHLGQKGVHTDSSLILPGYQTANYYAVMNPDGELHCACAAMDIYDHIPTDAYLSACQDWPADCLIFIDTNLNTSILEAIIKIGRRPQTRVCIDPVSVHKAKKLPSSLEGVWLIKPNADEVNALTGIRINELEDCKQAGISLLKRGVQNIVISLGDNGMFIMNDQQQHYLPSQPIHSIQDVNGAGDAFIAGLLFGIQHNATLVEACEIGANAATLTLQSKETVEPSISAMQLVPSSFQPFTQQELTHALIF